jgi:hypothetical protein
MLSALVVVALGTSMTQDPASESRRQLERASGQVAKEQVPAPEGQAFVGSTQLSLWPPRAAAVPLGVSAPSLVQATHLGGGPPLIECTLTILNAKPSIDSAFLRSATPDVDPGIVRRSRCAR